MLLEGELPEEGPCLYFLSPTPTSCQGTAPANEVLNLVIPFHYRQKRPERQDRWEGTVDSSGSLKDPQWQPPTQVALKVHMTSHTEKWARTFSDLSRTLIWPFPSSQPSPRSQWCPLAKGLIYSFCKYSGQISGRYSAGYWEAIERWVSSFQTSWSFQTSRGCKTCR